MKLKKLLTRAELDKSMLKDVLLIKSGEAGESQEVLLAISRNRTMSISGGSAVRYR